MELHIDKEKLHKALYKGHKKEKRSSVEEQYRLKYGMYPREEQLQQFLKNYSKKIHYDETN
jgi:hypothetical protein